MSNLKAKQMLLKGLKNGEVGKIIDKAEEEEKNAADAAKASAPDKQETPAKSDDLEKKAPEGAVDSQSATITTTPAA
eukprot:CAMPEP_0185902060 /NCGR_PEP_ID=MMETSP0196C-20130402/1355_1 /TAXON_ID=2932 /ORGANISM="Alexandrium fundyense, Strain CCMP1719" /LENGTH=76 /DNA_ID=CAMNT_0028620831 /DNA_START=103 /DNA_END=333 /DNA_ORIENTATION=+